MTDHTLKLNTDKRDDSRDVAHMVYSHAIIGVNMMDSMHGSGLRGSNDTQTTALIKARRALGDAAQALAEFIGDRK